MYGLLTHAEIEIHILDPKNRECDVKWSEFSRRHACHTHQITEVI
jgi:hypothetical protein